MFFLTLIYTFFAFIFLWLGAGLIVTSVDKVARKLHLSSFSFSFFILGLLTSIPEFAVGMTAVVENRSEVFVGNLIGGIPVIFLFIIPLLAIFGNGITLEHNLNSKNMIASFLVILLPMLLIVDKRVTNSEGIIMILSYIILFFLIERNKGILDTEHSSVLDVTSYSLRDILKVLAGVAIVFVASHTIVDNTLYFADIFRISPFYISLLFLSLGTNLPELSIAIRAVISGKKGVALGDYIGSAAANTLLFGIFTLLTSGEVIAVKSFVSTFLLMTGSLGLFFYFSKTQKQISRNEGFALLIPYALFIALQQFANL